MNWTTLAGWEMGDGAFWVTATTYPGQDVGTGKVSIQNGTTVTVDITTANPISSLIIDASGILQYEASTAHTLTVDGIVTINSGGIFRNALTGTVTTHQLIVGGSIVNNGTIDFSTMGNASGAGITFTGASNATFDLSGATLTNLRQTNGLILNKGTSSSSVLSFIPGGTFQVLSGNALGFLTITSGTFSLMGSNAFSNPVFYASTGNYTIPAAGGFWLDNPNATIVGMYGTLTNAGELIIKRGTYNIGTGLGNESLTSSTGTFEMRDGTLNISGRFRIGDGNCTITGGTMNLATIGHANRTLAAFYISPSANLTMSGDPLITFAHPNSAIPPFNDLEIEAGAGIKTIVGGTFQMGTAATPPSSIFLVNSDIPIYNLSIYNAKARVSLIDHLTVNNQLTLNGRLLMNNYNLNIGAPAIAGTFRANAGMIVTGFGTGEVRKTITTGGSYLFPLGDGSGATPYLPVTLNFTGGTFTPGASVAVGMVRYKHPQNANTNNYLKRYWTVRTNGIINPVYNFTGNYATADIIGNDAYINTGVYTTAWEKLNPSSFYTITATGLTGNVDISGINVAAPLIQITPASASICKGSPVPLTAVASGDPPLTYSWAPATGLSTRTGPNTTANPTITTTYTVTVKDGSGEAVSASVTVTVNPVLPVIVTIASSDADNIIYAGTSITFTASPTNGGDTPSYQWKVNGLDVGGNSSIYSYIPSNNDDLTCELTSSITCAAGNPATSNPVNMIVNPIPTVIICPAQPAAICANTAGNYTHVGYTWDATETDNFNVGLVTYTLSGSTIGTGSSLNGVVFSSGITKVVWQATVTAGNFAECTFNVTINALPLISNIYHN